VDGIPVARHGRVPPPGIPAQAPAHDLVPALGGLAARVAVVARSLDDMGSIATDPRWVEPKTRSDLRLWTDDYSSLLPIYRQMVTKRD
jgi:hypothetical protein